MKITVKMFAMLQEQVGQTATVELSAPYEAKQLRDILQADYPEAKTMLQAARLAVNQTFVEDEAKTLTSTDEVALIPPVSGG